MSRRVKNIKDCKRQLSAVAEKGARTPSANILCRHVRSALAEIIIFIERDCRDANDDNDIITRQRLRLYGEKENCIGALTKSLALLTKLSEAEQGIKSSARRNKNASGSEDGGVMHAEDIELLKRFLDRADDKKTDHP